MVRVSSTPVGASGIVCTILEAHRDSSEKCWTRAVDYMLGRWPLLCRYTGDGRLDIDNNAVERVIRPLAVGRKSYLFAGAHQNALFYSLMVPVPS